MAMAAKVTGRKPGGEIVVDIDEVVQDQATYHLLGTSPLIYNSMSKKVMESLLLPPQRKTASEKGSSLKHDVLAEYRDSPYYQYQGETLLSMPGTAIKAAMMTAALDLPGVTKAQTGRLAYVARDWIPMYGTPELMMSVVRMADVARTPDVRTRAILREWACDVTILWVKPIVSMVSISKLLAAAGMTAGLGDFRVEKGKGNYGRFTLVNDDDPDYVRIKATQGRKVQQSAMNNPGMYDPDTEALFRWFMSESAERGFKPTLLDDHSSTAEKAG